MTTTRKAGRLALRENLPDWLLYLLIPSLAAILAWFQVSAYLRGTPEPPGWARPPLKSPAAADVRFAPIQRGSALSHNEEFLGTADLRLAVPQAGKNLGQGDSPLRGGTLFLGNCDWLPDGQAPVLPAADAMDDWGSEGGPGALLPGMAYCEGSALSPAPGHLPGIPRGRTIQV